MESQWIKVSDHMPEEKPSHPGSTETVSENVLAVERLCCDRYIVLTKTCNGKWLRPQPKNITHWMPLPELPPRPTP